MSLRHSILTLVKLLGGFALARRMTAKGLRILCYHGISVHDEHCFQPKLFIREDTFRKRIAYLGRWGYPVLPLDQALALMYRKVLPSNAVVITFDDGWFGIGLKAAPLLREHEFPSTLYVTTRDVVDETPVFDVALRYLLWKGREKALDMRVLGLSPEMIALNSPEKREQVASRLSEAGREEAGDRQALLDKLAQALDVDDGSSSSFNRLFRLMTMEQLALLPEQGMDLELHTHRHFLPIGDAASIESEILDNRMVLRHVADGPLRHFCYPSGQFHPSQFPLLRALGVESATTCLSGFNYADTESLELRRFLDGENISQVEFEAEVSGFLELMRRFRQLIRGRRRMAGHDVMSY